MLHLDAVAPLASWLSSLSWTDHESDSCSAGLEGSAKSRRSGGQQWVAA